MATDKKESGRGQKRKAKLSAQSGKGNIRNLLGAMPAKKKEVCNLLELEGMDKVLSSVRVKDYVFNYKYYLYFNFAMCISISVTE